MPAKFDRCVAKVGTGGGKNPYAICNASMKRKKKRLGKRT